MIQKFTSLLLVIILGTYLSFGYIIPKLVYMKLQDLLQIFSERYNKPINVIGIRSGEKMLESLINETQSSRLVIKGDYSHIKSCIQYPNIINQDIKDYNSKINPLSKEELRMYLNSLQL
jgi:FlaA1/EpsC-like NDP-sugar epimerase